jgi:hypothetical protein
MAQIEAAKAADAAAEHVLKERLPTALACDAFRKKMQSIMGGVTLMGDVILGTVPGTRVRAFLTPGIPWTTFP